MIYRSIILVIALLVCLPISLLVQPYEGEKGDVNNDGTVDLLDAIKTVNIVLGIETPGDDEFWRADCNSSLGSCNGDGNVDLFDILKIVNIILGIDACRNTPPTASFTVDPTFGTTSTIFNVDASGCSDNEDPTSALQVRWDWENDEDWNIDWSTPKTASHQYDEPGDYTITLEVKDTEGLTDTETHKVMVSSGDGTVTDVDGNVYQTVTIGGQVWMAENLKVTHYRNSDPIPNVTDHADWGNLTTGAYCNYINDVSKVATYGRLYNWYAVNDSRSIAPEGWHVPSDKDWKQLEMHLGMSQSEADEWDDRGTDEGGKLKATGTIEGGDGLWYSPNTGATNSSGFSALPGGRRRYDQGEFSFMGRYVCFWSSTESFTNYAILRMLGYQFPKVRRVSQEENYGYSVRCIKD